MINFDQGLGLPAFPGAVGFGRYSKGGSGRHYANPALSGAQVLVVTSLADSGAGTLRDACSQNFPRIVVFQRSGIISLQTPITITNPYITIAGETAPGNGILIRNLGVTFSSNDYIMRFVTVMPGDGAHIFVANLAGCITITDNATINGVGVFTNVNEGDYLRDIINSNPNKVLSDQNNVRVATKVSNDQIIVNNAAFVDRTGTFTLNCYRSTFYPVATGPDNIDGVSMSGERGILDHCSVRCGEDECVSMQSNYQTLQNSIVSHGMNGAWHPEITHAKGVFIGTNNQRWLTIYGNILAHQDDRMPRCAGDGQQEVVNNLIYNWQQTSAARLLFGGSQALHLLRNRWKPGPQTGAPGFSFTIDPAFPALRMWTEGCVGPGRATDTGDAWGITNASTSFRSFGPLFESYGGFPVMSVAEMEPLVLANAGDRPLARSAIDATLVSEVQAGAGGAIINTQADLGGYPDASAYPQIDATFPTPSNPFELERNGYTKIENLLFTHAYAKGARYVRHIVRGPSQ